MRERAALEQLAQRCSPAVASQVRRRLEHQGAQHSGNRFQPRPISVDLGRILLRELRDLVWAGSREIFAIVEGKEVRDLALDDSEAVVVQIEIANDFRVEQ